MLASDSGKQEWAASAHTRVEFIQTQLGIDKGFVQKLLRRYKNQHISKKRFSVTGTERTRSMSGRAGDAVQPCRGRGMPRGARAEGGHPPHSLRRGPGAGSRLLAVSSKHPLPHACTGGKLMLLRWVRERYERAQLQQLFWSMLQSSEWNTTASNSSVCSCAGQTSSFCFYSTCQKQHKTSLNFQLFSIQKSVRLLISTDLQNKIPLTNDFALQQHKTPAQLTLAVIFRLQLA